MMKYSILLISWATSLFCASIELPKPFGPHQVGTRRIEAIDQSRLDPWAPKPELRALMLQLWYPVQNSRSLAPTPWLPSNASRWFEDAIEAPAGLLSSINTHVTYNGTAIFPLTENNTTPILVFSPGSGGLCALYSTFLSALASFGYTIIGVDHPYDSSPLERPDGQLVLQANTTDDIEFAANVRQADVLWLAGQISRESVCGWLPSSTARKSRLGSDVKLGVFGHSLGGDAASLAMQHKATLYKASASLDGAFFSPLNKTGFYGPLFYMSANRTCCHGMLAETWPLIDGWKQAVKINETTHVSFCDLIAMIDYLPEDASQDVGTLAPERMIKMVVVYLKAFWEWTLLGKKINNILQHESHLYPEISFEDLELGESPEPFLQKQGNGLQM